MALLAHFRGPLLVNGSMLFSAYAQICGGHDLRWTDYSTLPLMPAKSKGISFSFSFSGVKPGVRNLP